ncbi:hypothetical protein FS373_31050 [Shewanella sp. YLB-07]|nr:hypothetical protein [Shewanella sp. YLB-07]
MSLDEARPKIVKVIRRKKKTGVKCLWIALSTNNILKFEIIDPVPDYKKIGNYYKASFPQIINVSHPNPNKGLLPVGEVELNNNNSNEEIADKIIEELKAMVMEEVKLLISK